MNTDINFLLDENLTLKTCHLPRLAKKNNSIIITLNRKDFSSFDPRCCGGILLLKVKPTTADMNNEALAKFFDHHFNRNFSGKSIVVTLMHDGTIKVRLGEALSRLRSPRLV